MIKPMSSDGVSIARPFLFSLQPVFITRQTAAGIGPGCPFSF